MVDSQPSFLALGLCRVFVFSWRALVMVAVAFGYPEQCLPQMARSLPPLIAQAERAGAAALDHTSRKTAPLDTEQARPAAAGNKKIALVIGNSSYRRLQKLNNPRHDAEDVCKKLQALNFEVMCHIDISTRSEFRQAVRSFSSLISPGTTAFFYYAGHGVQINGENYLLPTSLDATSAADVEDEALSLGFLLRMLEEARGYPNILVLDACRQNPFPTKIAGASSRGLARVEPPNGTILVYATAPNGTAIDGDGRNGLFTKHLLENLGKPGQKVDELFQVVAKGVEDEAQRRFGYQQTPYRSFSYSGAYCLAGCDSPLVEQQVEKLKRQAEEAAQKAQALSDENLRLKRQFEERESSVRELEKNISQLNRDASNTGVQGDQIRQELARLKQELDAARSQQREAEKLRNEAIARDAEIARLQAQVKASEEKASRLQMPQKEAPGETNADEILTIRKQAEEAARRAAALTEENARLKRAAEEGRASVADLEKKIGRLSQDAATVSSENGKKIDELARLRNALDAARKEQQAAEAQREEYATRDKEIAALKAQVSAAELRAQQLEAYRLQVQTLRSESAEKSNLLSKQATQEAGPKPIIVPSF